MRDIEFRGKRCTDKEWVYGYYVQRTDEHDQSHKIYNPKDGTWHKVIPESVGQYIGQKDKNGVKVYEGHKIQAYDGERLGGIFEIKYLDRSFCMALPGDKLSMDCVWYYVFEVIGNKRIKRWNPKQ